MRWLGLILVVTFALPGQSAAQNCPSFAPAAALGPVTSDKIVEASGIAASRKNRGIFWVHNDSGDSPRVFALNRDGRLLATYTLKGASARDWEDIALGPGPTPGQDYLWVGDIGSAGSPPLTVYRFVEPAVRADQTPVEKTIRDFTRIDLIYPDKAEHDAETLWVDPKTGDIYILTKSSGKSLLFKKRAPHSNGKKAILELAATLDFSTLPGDGLATGGDITAKGDFIVVRTYSHAFVWAVPAKGPITTAFASPPCRRLFLKNEPQGEAIAFTPEGDLVTFSETRDQPIYFYERK